MTERTESRSLPLDAAVDAAIAFSEKASYLRHPDVPYSGTANGDSPEQWNRRYVAALCRVILAAQHSETERNAVIEECALACEEMRTHHDHIDNRRQDALLLHAADRLRALKEKSHAPR